MVRLSGVMKLSVSVLVTGMLLLLIAGASCSPDPGPDLEAILAGVRARTAPISTLSALIVGEDASQPPEISRMRFEFRRPARCRVETSRLVNGERITLSVLSDTTFWIVHPGLGEAKRSDAPDFPVWSNELCTFFGICLAPEQFLAAPLQLTLDGTDRIDGVEVFVLRVVEPPPDMGAPEVRQPVEKLICRVDTAEFGLRSMEVDHGGGVSAQLVVKRSEQLTPGFSLPVELQVTYPFRKRTIRYHVRDIHINDTIPDARFEVPIGEHLLVRDAKPLSEQAYKSKIEVEPNNPHLHYNLGLLYLRSRSNLDEAEEAFKRTISLRPRARAGYSMLASLYQTIDETEEAVKILEQAVSRFPDDADFHERLSNLYERTGQCDLAIKELRRKLELTPEHPYETSRMARLLHKTGDFDGAVRLYREILDSDLPPSDSTKIGVASELVNVYERALRLEELEQTYREIGEEETVDVLSLKILADIYLALGKQEEAVSVWKRLSAKAGAEDGRLLLALASEFSRNEMFAEAQQVCKQVIGSTEDEYVLRDARSQLESTYRPPEQKDKLHAYYEERLATATGSHVWWEAANWLMKYYEQRNELGTFIDKLTELAGEHPGEGTIYMALVRAYKQNEDYQGAIDAYKKAIEMDPRNLHFRHALAQTYEEAGLYDEAIAAYNALIESHPDYSSWYHSLAKLQYRLGKRDEAHRTIEQAMRSIPKDVQWYTTIADMYGSVGDYEKAESLYLKAIELAPEVGTRTCGMDDGPGQGSKLALRSQLAQRYREWGETAKAEEQYRRVIAKAEGEWFRRSAVLSLAEMYRETGSLDAAAERHKRVLTELVSEFERIKTALAETAADEEIRRKIESAKEDLVEHSTFLALLYEDMKKPKEAAAVYETVAEVLREDSDAWTRFVEACEKAELYDKAVIGYEKLLELMPDRRRRSFAELATLHKRLGNTTKSIEFTEKLLAVGADDEATHRVAADLYSWNRMYEKAAEHYLQAIEHTRDLRRKSDYRLSLARTYREMEEYERAKEVYETLLTTPGTDATKQRAREELHYIYEKIGRTSEAIDQADERVRSLQQKRTSLLEGISELERSHRDDSDAVLEVARLKREFAEVQDELMREYELLATTYERQQDVEKAIETLESFLQIVPEEQRSKRLYLYQRVAFAYMRAGDGEKAVECAKKTVQEEPYVSGWHNGLAQAYEHNEMYPEAAEEYKKAIELGKDPLIRTQNRLRLAGAYSMMSAHGLAEEEYKRVLEETTETIFLDQARRGLLCLYALQEKLKATLDMLEGREFELYKVAVEQYINFGKREEAAAILREPISITADDVELCMELAYLLHKSALFRESLALYERVVELAPDSPHAKKAAEEIAALKRSVKRE